MRLIDADKLYPDSVSIKGDRLCISQSQIANAPTVCDLEQIGAEIDRIEINGQVDEHTLFVRSGEQVKQMALDIIDKYKGV